MGATIIIDDRIDGACRTRELRDQQGGEHEIMVGSMLNIV